MNKLVLSALAIVLTAGCATAPDPFRQAALLGRGMNLGNALEAPAEGEWGLRLEPEYFRLIREAGFDSVRIPIRWSAHAAGESPWKIDEAFFARVDWAVAQAFAHDLRAVINIHHYEELMQDPAGHRARFLGLWEQIAGHYRGYPPELYFEILNEPNGALTPEIWNGLLAEAVTVIRRTHPGRTLVIDTAPWGGLEGLAGLALPPADRNIIASFHYYAPFHFTHQGASWVEGADAWLGATWTGTDDERRAVIDDFARAAAWGREHQRPLWIGEFGAYSRADFASRVEWTSFVSREAEKAGMMWAYWEFGSGFGAYDPDAGQWRAPLLNALVPVLE